MKKRILIIICFVLLVSVCHAANSDKSSVEQTKHISMTIVYDNYVFTEGLKTDWGFSCFLTGTEKTILFDTGTKGELLLENIEKLKINPKDVEIVVISHNHGDHTGGLLAFLGKNSNVSVYLPPSCSEVFVQKVKKTGARVITTKAPVEICKGVHLTGPMGTQIVEQSMIVDTAEGAVVITGCAHPGIEKIVKQAQETFAEPVHLVMGGFHLRSKSETEIETLLTEFRNLGIERVGPSHCTGDLARRMFAAEYGQDYIQVGVGKIIEMDAEKP